MTRTLIDSGARIEAAGIKRAGHVGSFGYLSTSRPGTFFSGKPIRQDWVNDMNSLGLMIVSCWQFGKNATADWRRGFNGGVADAKAAARKHRELGGPDDAPIYFAVDDDVNLSDYRLFVRPYLQGVNSVIGVNRTGVYGHDECVTWAATDQLLGKTRDGSGKTFGWQTRAWSEGDISRYACVYQRIVDTASTPGPPIDGNPTDVNDMLCDDIGQWNYGGGKWNDILTQMLGTKD
ncbi:putative lysin [Gordonia phage GMA3]|uniref:Putative lysin n=1 Tax=Gordonia phage GMA3 TaxID=1647284 RepID=A0A0K0NKU4_9CAUD|nr:endolysin [Gordonia phage GMA3]AKL88199.1 putative lysin [Gordonia phage GMA3]